MNVFFLEKKKRSLLQLFHHVIIRNVIMKKKCKLQSSKDFFPLNLLHHSSWAMVESTMCNIKMTKYQC